ncbi:MAG: hypothetical protein AABX91_00610 [Nanoarchaeota archaeon]
MSEKKRLIVAGYGRHGKDTFCEMLREIANYTFTTSSFVASQIVFDEIGGAYGYKNAPDCWEDRANHRAEWYEIITKYNTPDKSRLGRRIFEGFPVYCGIRNFDEFNALKERGLFDLSVWIDASLRMPPEAGSSMTVRREDCDIVVDNNGGLEELERRARYFCREHLS